MTQPYATTAEISCLWAYNNPDLAFRSFEKMFQEYGKEATYKIDMSRSGFFSVTAVRSDTVKTNVGNMKSTVRAAMESHVDDFITEYRKTDPWVMERYDEQRRIKYPNL